MFLLKRAEHLFQLFSCSALAQEPHRDFMYQLVTGGG